MKLNLLACLFLAWWSSIGEAQERPPPHVGGADLVWVLQPNEKETLGCSFPGRTVSTATASVTKISGPQTDGNPAALITNGPQVTTPNVDFTVDPGTTRNGNNYVVTITATDNDGNKPRCDVVILVRAKVFEIPRWP
jgi:hypothetical protein